jgi:polyhydroxybutyrate depolymerase
MQVAKLVSVAAATLSLSACGMWSPALAARTDASSHQLGYMTVGGVQRAYVIVRPAALGPAHAAPLVVALHGYTLNAAWMEANTGFDQVGARAGFVVVYPEGIKNSWNAGGCCGHNTGNDVGFIRDLIDRLVASGAVDPKRVFVTGMSNGAAMAQRVACELADRVTAVASVSGSLLVDPCVPSRPISVLEIHGTDDSVIPYRGGFTSGLGEFPSTMSVMETWERVDGCAESPAVARSGITTTSTWGGCRGGAVVVLDAISGGKHVWFGPNQARGEPDAADTVWDFFSRVPPPP